MISRASRAVSPMLEQVLGEEEVEESEERTSDDEEQDHWLLHGIDDESEIQRVARQLRRQRHAHRFHTVEKFKNISARISSTGAGANFACLVAESAHSIDGRTPSADSLEVATVAVD